MGQPGTPIHLRLLYQALQYRGSLALAVFVLAGSSVLTILTPALAGYAIDTGLNVVEITGSGVVVQEQAQGSMGTLMVAVGLIAGTALLRGVFVYAQTYLGESIGQSVARDLRNQVYDRLQRLSFAYHDNAEVGQIMSRATADVEGVRFFVSMGVIRLLYVVALVSVSYGLMINTNTKVGLIAVAFVPPVAIQSTVVSLMMRRVWLRVQEIQGEMSTVLQENLTGQRVVKAFSRQEFEQRKFDRKVDELFVQSYSTAKFQAFNEPFLVSVWLLSAAVVFWVGVQEIQAGRMSEGDLAAFQLWLTLLQVPVRSTGFIVNIFARAHSSGTRLFEIIDAESPVQEKPDAVPLAPGPGHVLIEDVSFGYNPRKMVVRNLDIEAMPGQRIALLGPTGSGKSTVVNLLPRFYDPTVGRVLIDGQDVRDLQLQSLRDAIGIVQQDVFLFSATIRENISYGRPGATQEEIEEAAKAARIHDFIMSQPDGYDMWVGERGSTLSGGQRQRVAIARTLLLNPRILIFDDSTAAVDMRTEFLIQEALRNLMEGRTTFVIAQRLRTVKEADLILVMQDGEIVERGKHEELLEHGQFYKRIYDLELRDQEEAAAAVTADEGGA
ncbi:MAG: ABC transporter ATP-binding protein [Dehalococcoidia bacterium]|nr:ABC transporter ATP-binding protein [Dehalococcoidia bacterium]MCA9849077.1 ABC transporter ATP-binding protein [Dehalococcoidia bacterium]MCB9482622.1 ABC transporter ATP-binding protein [Dehalococcoidia bacterium]